MSCTEWQTRLDAYVDAELAPSEMESFRAHASTCATCASTARALIEAKGALRRAGRRYVVSSDLRANILSSNNAPIGAATRKSAIGMTTSGRSDVGLWPRWVMAAAALLLLAAGLFIFANRYPRSDALTEFADLHVSTLASANPVEVVSTDRHTVKPWFQGRIPFTFDLPDLQGSPFTLTGGRVAYFHQEPGAHLIFTYQRHFISAFIFRDTPELSMRQTAFSDRGTSFNLQTWTQDGLRYVLVSDVNAANLQQLANLMQHHP